MKSSIIDYYNHFDEWGRLEREPIEFLINWHYMRRSIPGNAHVLDIGAGPGKYSMELARTGCEVTLADLTPRLVEMARDMAGQLGLTGKFRGFHTADATDLSMFEAHSFDAALMMGPLYHLQDEHQRSEAVSELYRIAKPGAPVFVAFMTRPRMLMTSLAYPLYWKPNHEPESLKQFEETGIFNHTDLGRFTGAYYYPVEEIEPFMASHGFRMSQLIGSSSVVPGIHAEQLDYWRSFGEERFGMIMDMVCREAANPYNLGVSSHVLYIGEKA
ncbi:class I SAM-dependent methyltransferase [Paenibacillus kobensis]|uniref:class I SAM-dependent methyltransferase n=1 Tax=Paenibacillus kobensis TaxID=59841 RepID=UPI000FDA6E52|nr:class I SAM-dependent methyltransferase [Paenibacillus kobensis]